MGFRFCKHTSSFVVSSGFPADPGFAEHGSSPESAGGKPSSSAAADIPYHQPPAGDHQETPSCQSMRSSDCPKTVSEVLFTEHGKMV